MCTIDNFFKKKCIEKENEPPQCEALDDNDHAISTELTASHSEELG